jgi:beta-glucosidase
VDVDVSPPYSLPGLDWLRRGSPLPADFLWGVANAAFQVEGGINEPGGPRNNWAAFERGRRVDRAASALDFWNRWPEHLDLAASMALNAFRFSIEWARAQRRPMLDLDPAAIRRYADVAAGCRARGMEPIVTLHHFTHPAWLGLDPWIEDGWPEAFQRYARRAVEAVNAELETRGVVPVRWWVTVNEPNIFAFSTAFSGAMPRKRTRGVAGFRRMLDRLLVGHVRAYRAIHAVHTQRGWPAPNVAFNTYCSTMYAFDGAPFDVGRARDARIARANLGNWLREQRDQHDEPLEGLGARAARAADRVLERILLPDVAATLPRYVREVFDGGEQRGFDFVGLDYYVGPLAEYLRWPGARRDCGRPVPFVAAFWETTIRPDGLRRFLLAHHRPEAPLPLLVVENGMATRGSDDGAGGRPDGWTRPSFLRAHVAELLEAARAGAPVAGYVHWTLADNYEWGSYEPSFGIHGVDRGDPAHPRILATDREGLDSAGTYGAIVRALRAGDGNAAVDTLTS